jgi:hypothetical protein
VGEATVEDRTKFYTKGKKNNGFCKKKLQKDLQTAQ